MESLFVCSCVTINEQAAEILLLNTFATTRHECDTANLFGEVTYVWHCWLLIYVYKSIIIDYPYYQLLLITHICVLYVYKNMYDILRKKKTCYKKDKGQNEDFFQLDRSSEW